MKKLLLLPLNAILIIILPSLWEGSGMDCFSQPIRNWGTYYGGVYRDYGKSVAVDANGNVYFTGNAQSSSGISTPGSHQPAFAGSVYDAYLVKFNGAGVRQWATYYGGGWDEAGYSIAVDGNGNVYLSGTTSSSSDISTTGSHQPVGGGAYPSTNAFLVKFNSAGVRQWGTYYGGTGDDVGASVAVDGSGNVYLGGTTNSTSGISTAGSHQPTCGGMYDAFIVKFNSAGVRQWATYYGGSDDEYNYYGNNDPRASSVAVDGSGNIYLAGRTKSTSGISTAGSYQPVCKGGQTGFDSFIVRFNLKNSSRLCLGVAVCIISHQLCLS